MRDTAGITMGGTGFARDLLPPPPITVVVVSFLGRHRLSEAQTTRATWLIVGIARGLSNKELAAWSGYRLHTIRSYLEDLFASLGVHTRAELLSNLIFFILEAAGPEATANQADLRG